MTRPVTSGIHRGGLPVRRASWLPPLAALGATALLVAQLQVGTLARTTLPPGAEAAAASITAAALEEHVRFLASEELEGRGAGQPGNDAAAAYLAAALDRLGMAPADGASYSQGFELSTVAIGQSSTLKKIEADGSVSRRDRVGDDFHPYPSSASTTAEGPLVFAGYGITAPELFYDDYEGLDVAGRIVVVLDHEPQEHDEESRFRGRMLTPYAMVSRKAQIAAGHGAAGLIVVPDVAHHPDPPAASAALTWNAQGTARRNRFVQVSDVPAERLPIAFVSQTVGERLLGDPSGRPVRLDAVQERIDRALEGTSHEQWIQAPASFTVPHRQVSLTVDLTRRSVTVRNVLGLLEGTDPVLRRELVIVGAHLDHEGVDEQGRIFPGADDDASGVAGVLEIAAAMRRAVSSGAAPRRSVLFAFWNAEEKGLLGSRHYLRHPVPAGHAVVAKLNLDMIGRSEDVPENGDPRLATFRRTTAAENANVLHLIGASYSPDLLKVLETANGAVGLSLRTAYDAHASGLLRRSDHWPFLEQGIPALFVTTGLHPDYHTPADTPDKLDYPKLERITRLVYRAAWDLATRDARPAYRAPR